MPWWIPLAAAGIFSIFGGGKSKQTQTTTTPSQVDPLYAALSPAMLQTLLKNFTAFQNFGMPAGFDLGFAGTMFGDIENMLKKEWPAIISGTNPAGKTTDQKLLGSLKSSLTR